MRGFILKDYLLTLLIIIILMPIVVATLEVITTFRYIDSRLQDEIALYHLQRRTLIASDFSISSDTVSFISEEKQWTIHYDGNRIYLTPGYQLFLDDVDTATFYSDGTYLYIYYEKEGQSYEKVITIL